MNKKIIAVLIIGVLLIGGCATAFFVVNNNKSENASLGDIYDGYYMDLSNANSLALVENDNSSVISSQSSTTGACRTVFNDNTGTMKTLYKTLDGIKFEKVKLKEEQSSDAPEEIVPEWNISNIYITDNFMFISVKTQYSWDYRDAMVEEYGFYWADHLYYLVYLETGKIFCINTLIDTELYNDGEEVGGLSYGRMTIYETVGNMLYYKVDSYGETTESGVFSISIEGDELVTKLILKSTDVLDVYQNGVVLYCINDSKYIWLPESKTARPYDPSIDIPFNGYMARNIVMDGEKPISYEYLNGNGTYTFVNMTVGDVESYFDRLYADALVTKKVTDNEKVWTYLSSYNTFSVSKTIMDKFGNVTIDCIGPEVTIDPCIDAKKEVVIIENNSIMYKSNLITLGWEGSNNNCITTNWYVVDSLVLRSSGSSIEYIDTTNWVKGELTDSSVLQFTGLYVKNGQAIVGGKSTSMADVKGVLRSDLTLDLSYTEPTYTITTIHSLN